MTILYVEDDTSLAQVLKKKLSEKFHVDVVESVSQAEEKIFTQEYSLIITDYFLPDKTGTDLCKFVRSEEISTPILFLTVNDSKKNIVQALDSGADDYLSKPFDIEELEARIRALIKRKHQSQLAKIGGEKTVQLCTIARTITCSGEIFELPRQEYILLEYLLLNTGRLVSRQEMYEQVWGTDEYYNSNTIDVHIRRLREKLRQKTGKNHIRAVYGMGYRFLN